MSDRDIPGKTSPTEVFVGLRRQLFQSDLASVAPAGDGSSSPDDGSAVFGAAMEVGLPNATYLVFGLRDGSASVYFSTGGGSLGGQGKPAINAAARRFVETSRPFAAEWPIVKEYPLPSPGRVRFSIFTAAGVRAREGEEADVQRAEDPLFPMFKAAHDIITGFRLLDQRQPRDENAYLNCLLTALARGSATSVTLKARTPPPDPASLTRDATDLKWIAEIGFQLDRLDTAKIIELLTRPLSID